MKTGYTVADAMTTKPITVNADMTVRDASRVMRDHDVGSLLVVDDGVLVGIILADDIVHRVTAEAKRAEETALRDIMTREIVDVAPKADIYDAMVIMREHDVMHLPVRDEQKKLVGFLTFKDVLKIEPTLFELMSEMAEISGSHALRSHKDGYCEICGNYSSALTLSQGKHICAFCLEDADEQ